MPSIIFWTIIFSITTTASIVLLGNRSLISGNLLQWENFLNLIFNWRFILSMIFALTARFSFILTNNALLKIPRLAESSTTITTFITLISLILVVLANVIFLKERLNVTQGIGAFMIMFGAWMMLR